MEATTLMIGLTDEVVLNHVLIRLDQARNGNSIFGVSIASTLCFTPSLQEMES